MIKNAKEQEYLRVYQKVTKMISMMLDHQQVMDTIVRSLPKLLAVDAATIRLIDSASGQFVLGAAHGLSQKYLSRIVIDTAETMEMICSGYPVAKTDISVDKNNADYALIRNEGIESLLTLPILFQDSIIGMLRLLTRKPKIFTSTEISFSMALAEQVGIAISNARMFNEMENQVDFMKEVQEISTLVNSTLKLQDVLNVIVDRLPRSIGCQACTIRLLKAQTNQLELVATSGLSEEYLHRGKVEKEKNIKVALAGEPVAIYDVSQDDRILYKESMAAEGIKSVLSVPIKAGKGVIGVIRILSNVLHSFTSSEVNFLMTVAEASGAAIRNAKTYQQITLLFEQIEENERFLADILNCIRPQLLVVDKNKRLVLVNKMLINTTGQSESDLLGLDYKSLRTEWPCSDDECPVNRVFGDGKVAMLQHQDGEQWYERTASPMLDDDGSVEYVIEVIRDVTAKKQLEEEHLQRTKLQGVVELAGTVAHEINSPLFAALGTAQLLEDDLTGEEAEDVVTIIRNLKEIKKLTNKMTTMTGFESKDYVGDAKIVTLT